MARRTLPAQTVEEARRALLTVLPRRPMTWEHYERVHKFMDGLKGLILVAGDPKAHVQAADIIADERPDGRVIRTAVRQVVVDVVDGGLRAELLGIIGPPES